MTKLRFVPAILAVVVLSFLTACGSKNSTGPAPTPTPTPPPVLVDLSSLGTGSVHSAAITINGVTQTYKGSALTFSARPSDVVHVEAPGFRTRDTRVGNGLITLFSLGTDYSDTFVDELLFGPPSLGMLQQASGTIYLELDASTESAKNSIEAGAAIAQQAFGLNYQVLDAAGSVIPSGAIIYTLSLNPALKDLGLAARTTTTGLNFHITGGKIEYVDIGAAKFVPISAHECGHAGLTLGHVKIQKALMNAIIDGSLRDFTRAEKMVAELSLKRLPGTVAPDNDTSVRSSSARWSLTVECQAIY